VTPPETSAHAVTSRLREASARSHLTASRRLLTKVDMSPAAVTMRLRLQSVLRDKCLAWAPAARLADVASSTSLRQPRAEGVPGDGGMVSR
jgi:hypothetical protein